MSIEELERLRSQILDQAVPLLDEADMPLEDRFHLSLQAAQARSSLELYEKAFSLAGQLEGRGKLDAYLDLLSDVDFMIEDKSRQSDDVSDQTTEQ